jgi:hypothetical protein
VASFGKGFAKGFVTGVVIGFALGFAFGALVAIGGPLAVAATVASVALGAAGLIGTVATIKQVIVGKDSEGNELSNAQRAEMAGELVGGITGGAIGGGAGAKLGTALGTKFGAGAAGTIASASGLTRRQAAMLEELRAGKDVVVRDAQEARLLLENSGLKPYTSQNHLPAAPAPRGTYRGDLLNTADPTAPFVHPPGAAPPGHALSPHYNLYFLDGKKATIIIRTD